MTRNLARYSLSGGPGGAAPLLAAGGVSPYCILILCLLCIVAGCAGQKPARDAKGGQVVYKPKQTPRQPKPSASGYASADEKNVHDTLVRLQNLMAGDDEKAIARMYTDDARVVPLLSDNKRVLSKKEFESRLSQIVKQQRRLKMRLVFREPMTIKVTAETAQVQALADLVWTEAGQARHVALDCQFSLERIDYTWKIRQAHQSPAAPGQIAPSKGAAPAIRQAPPGRPGTAPSAQPLIPTDEQAPKPLF